MSIKTNTKNVLSIFLTAAAEVYQEISDGFQVETQLPIEPKEPEKQATNTDPETPVGPPPCHSEQLKTSIHLPHPHVPPVLGGAFWGGDGFPVPDISDGDGDNAGNTK